MLVLTRKKNEEVILKIDRAAVAALREWLHRLPIDQERLTEGVELLDDLAGIEARVMLIEIRGDKARLGVEAPRELISVHRLEIQERIETGRARRELVTV